MKTIITVKDLQKAALAGAGREFEDLCNKVVNPYDDKVRKKNPTIWAFQPFSPKEFEILLQAAQALYTKGTRRVPEKFLDVGSGMGDKCLIAEKYGLQSAGIELSPDLLKKARLVSPKTIFFEQDIFSFKEYDQFDIIWVFNPTGGVRTTEMLKSMMEQATHPMLIMMVNTAWRNYNCREVGGETVYKYVYPKGWRKVNGTNKNDSYYDSFLINF